MRKWNVSKSSFLSKDAMNEGFIVLGQFDLMRGDNDLRYYSVSAALSFNTLPPTSYLQFFNLWQNYDANEFFRNLQLSNAEALVRIRQVPGPGDGSSTSGVKSERQKVKIISLQTC